MTPEAFQVQVGRLKQRFGPRAFDDEFLALLWREVAGESASAFERHCDVIIETRHHTRPPLMADFREFVRAERTRAFKHEIHQATQAFKAAPQEMRQHLKVVLSRDFEGAGSVSDAVAFARGRKHRDDDPDGDGAA